VLLLVSSQWHGSVLLLLPKFQQKLSMQVSVDTGLYLLYGADEVSGKVVIEKSLSYMLLLMAPEQVWGWYCCSYCFRVLFCFLFLCPLFSVLSFLWDSLWLIEEVLTLLCLLLIMRMEIS
jgi:hypothetical protein